MSENEVPNEPGYDKHGQWHGSATAEVEYWKRRALAAESRHQNTADALIQVVTGRNVQRQG